MDPFNALFTTTAARKIPQLKEAPLAKVISCALIVSTDLEKDFDATKEVIRGAGVPSVKMASQSAKSPSWLAMVCGHSTPMMRAGHHQRAKVLLVPEAAECTRLVLFPLIQ
jgi:hypothetical protein